MLNHVYTWLFITLFIATQKWKLGCPTSENQLTKSRYILTVKNCVPVKSEGARYVLIKYSSMICWAKNKTQSKVENRVHSMPSLLLPDWGVGIEKIYYDLLV